MTPSDIAVLLLDDGETPEQYAERTGLTTEDEVAVHQMMLSWTRARARGSRGW